MNPDEANLGGYVGFIFGGLAFVGTIWAYVFIPETKGRTVDECVSSLFLVFTFCCGGLTRALHRLDLLYEKRVPARQFVSYRLYDGDAVNM